jgi:ABC-type lipoprotein export system ATPase subunit
VSAAPAVSLRDVFRVYSTPQGDAAALQGLTAEVLAGEIVVVLGPSGSGKSTLLRLLAGLERPSAGEVRVLGHDVGRLSPRRLARLRAAALGYADQRYAQALAAELPAREAIALQARLAGESRRSSLARADDLLTRVGLDGRGDARPAQLSGGEQQRIAVCAAVAHRPALLIADEPTAELDAANAQIVHQLLRELVRDVGGTAVIVSHDPSSAEIADRALHVRDGRVSDESTLAAGGGGSIVVGRGGWLRLPEDLLARAGISDRATARLGPEGIVVSPAGGLREPEAGDSHAPLVRLESEGGAIVAAARGLTRTYGRAETATTPIASLEAEFRAGRLAAVTGPSGSGKTTLLQLVAGLDLPTAGVVDVLGRDLTALDRADRARFRRRHIAIVGQQTGLVPFLSARENVELGLQLRHRHVDADAAVEALDAVGLEERADQRVDRLSAGEQARVEIARAVAAGPELLLADEPTARLDAANALAVAALLARLARERGTAVVCATHDPLVIEQADDVLALRSDDVSGHPSAAQP